MVGGSSWDGQDHSGVGRAPKGPLGCQRSRQRGGVRIIYFWWTTDAKILLLDIYAKSEKEDLDAAELKKLKRRIL